MQALAKLVNSVVPDLVLFVGEALVGNDGVDQLSLFNKVRAPLACSHFCYRAFQLVWVHTCVHVLPMVGWCNVVVVCSRKGVMYLALRGMGVCRRGLQLLWI